MCFSITASLTTAAILIPSGIYCIKEAKRLDKPYWAFAMLPFMFGVQQLLEGGVWFGLLNDNAIAVRTFSLGFLAFSHVLWLGWVSYSAYLTESSPFLKHVFKLITIVGVFIGLSMFVPLLFNPDWLSTSVVNNSIYYDLTFITDGYMSQPLLTAAYAAVILIPLLLTSDRYHKILGVFILISGVVSWVFYNWVFVSVWCYFAAVISLYVFYVILSCVKMNLVSKVA